MTHKAPRSFARTFTFVYAALWATTLAGAGATVGVPGAGHQAQRLLGLALAPRTGSVQETASIAATNARIASALLLCAGARRYLASRRARTLLNLPIIVLAALNAGLVGVAAGAYGQASLPYLIHLPLEWAAFAVAGAEYAGASLMTRRIFACGALLIVAAGVETYVTPQE